MPPTRRESPPSKVLFATPECAPLAKTGGLGDVSAALPAALLALGLVIGGIAYKYADELSNLAQSVTGGKTGHAHGHFHY